jgi:hypothetical protein
MPRGAPEEIMMRLLSLRSRLCVLLICGFTCAFTAPLHAWGPIGHMTVGYIAYQSLAPATKARVAALLKMNPDFPNWEKKIPAGTSADDHDLMIFMIATTWADDIKGESNYSDDGSDGGNTPDGATSSQNIGYSDLLRHRYWHFVDTPFSPDNTKLPDTPTPNVQTQIDAFRAVLSSSQGDDLKSYDLSWLLHLVGDVHQPLHATTRVTAAEASGDSGGNDVKLMGDESSNLHSYWDALPGFDCSSCSSKIACINRAMALGKTLKSASRSKTKKSGTATWVNESFGYAKSTVYTDPIGAGTGPYTIPPKSKYESKAETLADKQVALAGARLAQMLNTELK